MRRALVLAMAAWLLCALLNAAWAQRVAVVAEEARDGGGEVALRPARLQVEEVSLATALTELSRASGVAVAFSPSRLSQERTVSCVCRERTVGEALDQLLRGTPYRYVEVRGHIVVLLDTTPEIGPKREELHFARPVYALGTRRRQGAVQAAPRQVQEGTIAGRVVDETTGQPLAAVQISVPGTGLGTLTNNEGRYVLPGVPAGDVEVRAELLGYRVAEDRVTVVLGDAVSLDFALGQSAIGLDEIVVTGTPAAVSRRELGVALDQLDADEILENAATRTVGQMLQARSPGITVFAQSGMLGNGSIPKLRGIASLTLSNIPMIYVDGVRVANNMDGPSRLDDINPEDIESIEVIKGPAASTLYGTEASNGVIQILTKQGRAGGTSFTLRTTQGANWLMNPEGRFPTTWGITPDGEIISQDLVAEETAAGRPIFRTGHVQSYFASMRGGTAQFGYYMSGDYSNEQGVYRNNDLERFTARTNVHAQVREDLLIRTSLGFVTSHLRQAPEGSSSGFGIMPMTLWGSPTTRDTPLRGFLRAPPEASNTIGPVQDLNRTTWSTQIEHTLFDWLSQRLTVGADVVDETDTELWPRHPDGAAHFFGENSLGQKELSKTERRNYTLDYAASASFDLTPTLESMTSFGVQYYQRSERSAEAEGSLFPVVGLETIGATSQRTADEDFVQNKTLGLFVQQRFGWQGRRFLTLAVRGDDNSAFGSAVDPAIYPKVSGVWVVSEEPFWNLSLVNELRLRGAWGTAGQQPDVFDAARTYSPTTGAGGGVGVLPTNIGNPELKPERGQELELGFDASLFNDRLGVVFTYYDQTTKDAIIEKNVAPSTGFSGEQLLNIGEIKNWGFELALDARLLDTERVLWQLGANIAHTQNRIEELGVPPIATGGGRGTIWHKEGYPVGGFWDRLVVQADRGPDGMPVNVLCAGGPENDNQPVPCEDAPDVYLGGPGPWWDMSVQSTLELWDRLRLSALVDIAADQRSLTATSYAADVVFRNTEKIIKFEEQDPIYQAMILQGNNGLWVENNSFVKLREISASYALPTALAQRFLGASSLSVNVSGRNLWNIWIHPEYTDIDPEINPSTSVWYRQPQTTTPPFASLVLSLGVTF